MSQSSAVATIPAEERQLRGLELAERHFPPERREQIAAFLELPAEHPALLPYLAWCAGMNLSPIAGHVWLIPKKIKAKDGEPERTIYKPAIGRDGLLHKARETKGQAGGYRGMKFGVVCERDTFEVEEDGTFDGPRVLHRYASKPTEFDPAGEQPDRWRGRVIGAWAKCFVDGEPPTFYYANLREHGRRKQVWAWDDASHKRLPVWRMPDGQIGTSQYAPSASAKPVEEWDGAWDYTSTMVLKAAQSYVLRIGLGVTGVVPVDELRDQRGWSEGDAGGGEAFSAVAHEAPGFDVGAVSSDGELVERLQRAIEAANVQDEFAWPPAKCEMVLSGRSDGELAAIVEQIERENDLRDQRAARASEPAVPAEPEVPEAEVVETPEVDPEEVERLRHEAADLRVAFEATEGEEKAALGAQLDQVESRLRELGAGEP